MNENPRGHIPAGCRSRTPRRRFLRRRGPARTHDATADLTGLSALAAAACHTQLIRWVGRLVNDDEVALDIAAEAFARLLSRWSRLGNPRGYLYMIAANLIHDHWRKTTRERNALTKLAVMRAGVSPCLPAQNGDLHALIDLLPQELRAVLLLHYYAGYQIREIAIMLGRPEGTIKANLFHARARLRAGWAGTAA